MARGLVASLAASVLLSGRVGGSQHVADGRLDPGVQRVYEQPSVARAPL